MIAATATTRGSPIALRKSFGIESLPGALLALLVRRRLSTSWGLVSWQIAKGLRKEESLKVISKISARSASTLK